MARVIKFVAGALLLLILLVVGGGAYLSKNLPTMVKQAVETYGPDTTGTKVTLGDIGLVYGTGRVTLKDLVIGNPSGFTTPHAFQLSKLAFQINVPSVFKDVVIIDEFSISGANIIAEQKGTSLKTNLQRIADRANQSGKKSKSTKQTQDSEESTNKKIIISEFRFTDNSIDLVSEQWGDRKIQVPGLILKDIGKKEGGLSPDQLTQRIVQLVTDHANKAARDELKGLAREKAKESFRGKAKEKFRSLFD